MSFVKWISFFYLQGEFKVTEKEFTMDDVIHASQENRVNKNVVLLLFTGNFNLHHSLILFTNFKLFLNVYLCLYRLEALWSSY